MKTIDNAVYRHSFCSLKTFNILQIFDVRLRTPFLLFLLISALVGTSHAQSCPANQGTAVNIASLPYNGTGLTTCGAGNDFTSGNTTTCGSSSYLGGEDLLFLFTPTVNGLISISLTSGSSWVGLKLYNGCPFNGQGGACVANAGSSSGNQSINTSVVAGVTYYLIVDTWPSPTCIPSFNLTISAPTPPPTCPGGLGSYTNIIVPFSATGLTTCGKGNDLTSSNVSPICGSSSYLGGEDEVFVFTPSVSGSYTINLTSGSSYVGIMLYNGCPLSGNGGTCVGYAQGSSGNQSITNILTAGVTYYLIVDSWPSPTCHSSYNLSIVLNGDPCSSITPLACGTSTTANLSGAGVWSGGSSCGYGVPGQEKIYSFTPANTGTATLQVTSTNSGGYVDYQYKLASGGCNSGGWTCIADVYSPGSYSFSVTGGQTYYLLLDAESTGSIIHTFQVNCPVACVPSITVTETSGIVNDGTICVGGSATLSVGAGTSYLWSNGATTQSITVSPLLTTTYSVTVTGGACPGTATKVVTVSPLPSASAGSNSPVCAGATISLTASGGTSYSWSGPGGWTSTAQNPTRPNATAAMAGSYTVTVTNAAGCSSMVTVDVTVNSLPSASAKADPNPVCTGHFAQLAAAGGGTYSWSGPNGFASTLQNPGLGIVQMNMAGTYTVTVTSAEGCSSTASINLVVNQSPNGSASVNPSSVCVGNTAQLSASGGQSYLWKGPGGFTSTQQNPVINVTSHVQGGTYWVTISNSNGCYVQLSVTLTVNYPPAVTATHDQSTACTGSTLKLFGTGIGTYLWTGPAGFTSSLQNPVIPNVTPANSGVYTLKVTNGSGCFAVASTTVSVVSPPNVTATVNDNTVCEGTNVYLYSGGASTYQWTGPWGWVSTFEDPIIYTIPAYMSGVYSVTGTGPTGCKSSASVTVNVYQLINGTVNATPNPVLLGGTLQLNATGGTSYLWTGPGGFYSTQSNPVIHNFNYKNVGTYTVIITNEGGCEMTLFVTVDLVLPLQGDNVNNFTVSTTKLVEGHIYPNPSSNYITLQRHETASVVYSIIDMKGNVLIKNATTDSGQVNIESLTPGSYHVLWSQPGVARDAFKGSFIKVK
ncbi:MAG: PKD domain-containing protein [Candidatus Parvibacillus calidus]|nr:MAG: PKD domain-containing protein [Candidatus Parvibacillus calidus]